MPPAAERELLSPLPLAALRLDGATVAGAGARRLEAHRRHHRSAARPLAARFGTGLLRQLDRALGREHEPLNPRLPVAPYVAEQRFAEPIAREEDVLGTVERLAGRLKVALERRGDGARRIELTLFRTDGEVHRIAAGTSRPLREPHDIRALFIERLAALADEFDPGFGFDMARLSVVVAEPCPPEQIGIGDAEDAAEIDRLVDRLSARLGRSPRAPADRAGQPHPRDRRRQRAGADDWRRSRLGGVPPFPRRGGSGAAAACGCCRKPEPIEAVAEVPDGPPVRFRWRRALHEVIAAEGPERIEGAWWSEHGGPGTRDYFRVEDKSGLRFWLFRAGLYRDLAQGAAAPSWFLHGTYA